MRPAGWRTGQPRGDDAPRGFVVVLGWLGAQDKHLKKYSDLLEEAGFATGRSIAPKSVLFGTRASQRTYALQVLSATLADSAPALPIAFYLFSNGGAFVYRAMLPWLVSDPAFADVRARHRATCFDSAPCYLHPDLGARALSENVRSPAGKALIRCLFSLFAIVSSGFGSVDLAGEYWRELRDDPLQAPTLYLYSEDDPLCDPQKLALASRAGRLGLGRYGGPPCGLRRGAAQEARGGRRSGAGRPGGGGSAELASWPEAVPPPSRHRLAELVAGRRQKRACAEVREVRWQVSEHVGHLRKHPEEYTAALLGFLRSCTTV